MLSNVEELELVSRLKTGDVQAFDSLIGRYSNKMFNLAMRITRSVEDAEEVLQEVYISVFSKISYFQEKSAFSSWLYRVTANAALMKLRARKKHLATSLEDSHLQEQDNWAYGRSDAQDVNYISTRHELREVLEKAVADLPSEYQAVFILRDIDGLSNQDVSEITGVSVAAVKSRLHRARLILRSRLAHYYDGGSTVEIDSTSFQAAA